jgi:Ca-activated chloride channel homolog
LRGERGVLVFETPSALLLLGIIPVLVYFRHFRVGRGGVIVFPHSLYNAHAFASRIFPTAFLYHAATVLFWAGVSFLFLAYAGPVEVERERVYLSPGRHIMVVLDESPTMAARDFEPENRFEAARDTIRRFIRSRENDPVGLVSFSLEAALRSPPTTDYRYLEGVLDDLKIMELGDGTAIGLGLALGVLHLGTSGESEKVILLLTDGKNNAGEISPEAAARVAAQAGIRVHTIGIGSGIEAPVEFVNPDTGRTYRGTVLEAFDEDLLREIARVTGGRYFQAGAAGTLDAVFQTIDSIETVERRARIEVRSRELYRYFIMIGMGLILAEFFIKRVLLSEVL